MHNPLRYGVEKNATAGNGAGLGRSWEAWSGGAVAGKEATSEVIWVELYMHSMWKEAKKKVEEQLKEAGQWQAKENKKHRK